MAEKYLPITSDNTIYSPKGILNKFKEAVKEEGGKIEVVLKNSKHKQVIELWHASPLAVMIYKLTGKQFYLFPADNPDIHFVTNINTEQEGFSVEIMTLYDFHKKKFDGDYAKIAKTVWDKKGGVDYDRAELLLVSRLDGQFDVDMFADEIKKYKWNFLRIWLNVYSSKNSSWNLFEIIPHIGEVQTGMVSIGLSEIPY